MKTTDKFVFFWDGTYSQWEPSYFIDDHGIAYNCCEQYMMAEKARFFGDQEALAKIMATPNPRLQKAIGRLVKNFDEAAWNEVCQAVVFKGNYFKFRQNPEMLKELMETGERLIVEASPYDKIWGIGMHEDDEGIEEPTNWKGTNWLGIACMKVRDVLKSYANQLSGAQETI